MSERGKDRTGRQAPSPSSPGRRRLILGLGAAAGGGAMLRGFAPALGASASPSAGGVPEARPFYGPHQAGVTTPRPSTGLVASFDVLATSGDELKRLFMTLTERISFLMHGGPAPTDDPAFPPPDSGVLGPWIRPADLTVTVALGASLFDGRFGLRELKPVHLEAMTQFPNDALDAELCHGDLLLQFCSDSEQVNIHALRDVIKNLPGLLAPRWKQAGFVPEPTAPRHARRTPRNLLGFKDGTANPDAGDRALMNRVVWVQPGAGEPQWAVGGTYQVVRIIRHFVERWDRTPLVEQQTIFGRAKASGAPLGESDEFDTPDYAADPQGKRIPLDAHIRLANPRTPATRKNLILRRPFNYSGGITQAGQLDMGLLFICFQASLREGFLAVQERLNGEPLEEYIKPVGGGYFFVLPGVPAKGRYLGQALLEAA